MRRIEILKREVEDLAALTTWGRSQSALRWLDRQQGKKRIVALPTGRPGDNSDTLT